MAIEFDVAGALKAGYTPGQVADYLAKQSDFDIAGARKAGYNDDQIINHLAPPPDDRPDVTRGFGVAMGQMAPLAKGAVGLAGATAEKALGEGGISTAVKNWGLKGYQEGMAKLQPQQKDTDELTTAWDRAKNGDLGALVDWAQYGLGYGAGQLLTAGATAVAGGLIGSAVAGPAGGLAGAAEGAISGGAVRAAAQRMIAPLVEKEIASIAATEAGAKLAKDQLTRIATANVAKSIGQSVALTGYAGVQEAGSIYPEAVDQARKEGRELDGADLARVWATTAGAAAVEGFTDKLGLGALTGKVKLPGKGGMLARGAVGGAAIGAAEGTTEGAQTFLERVGAGKSLTDEEAVKDYINSAGLGAIGGAPIGIVGGAVNKPQGPAPVSPDTQLNQSLDRLEATRNAVFLGGPDPAQVAASVISAPSVDAAIDRMEASSPSIGAIFNEKKGAYLAPLMDRQAELTQQANQAGTSFDRQSALEQAAVSMERGSPARRGIADQYEDLAPMDERTARGRLKVLRDMTANEGGDGLSLDIVPHPNVEGKFAIGRKALPSLDLPAQQPAPLAPGEAQQRLETAAVQGDFNQSRESFENKLLQQGLTRALQSIERRNGVATPEEAQLLERFYPGQKLYDSIQGQPAPAGQTTGARDEAVGNARAQLIQQRMDRQAGLTQPETPTQPLVIDNGVRQREPGRENRLERVNSSVEFTPKPVIQADTSLGATPAAQSGIDPNAPLGVASRRDAVPTNTDGLSLVPIPTANETASDSKMADLASKRKEQQDARDQANAAAGKATPAAPSVDATIAALRTIPALRTAQQKAVATAAMARFTPAQYDLLQRAATMPQGLSTEDRVQLRGLRAAEIKASEQRGVAPEATTVAPEATQQGKAVSILGNITTVNPATLQTNSKANSGTISKQTHRMISLIGSMFGKKIVLFSSDNPAAPDGFVRRGDSKTIHLNVKSQISHMVVFGHELLHQLKADNPAAYDALSKVIKLKAGADTNVAGIEGDMEELTADLVGNRFRETEFWQDVFREILTSGTDVNVSRRSAMKLGASVVRVVDRMVKALKGMTGFDTDSMVDNLQEVKSAVTKALASYAQAQRGEATQLIREQVAGQQTQAAADTTGDVVASANRQIDTPQFKRWFGNSQVVDGKGRPLVVYHGTGNSFSKFARHAYTEREGFYFTSDPEFAGDFAENSADGIDYEGDEEAQGPSVMPVYLSLKNPVDVRSGWPKDVAEQLDDTINYEWLTTLPPSDFWLAMDGNDGAAIKSKLESLGYDGLIATEAGAPVYVAFRPEQIKSAIGNNGAFSPSNPDIRKSEKRGQLDNVEAYHYSRTPRKTLSSGTHGTGLQDANREQFQNAADKRLRERIYFYVDKGSGIFPLPGLGGHAHRTTLNNVYDMNADPQGLRKGKSLEAFESAVLDAGFDGYLDRRDGTQAGVVIMLGKRTITPEYLGTPGPIRARQKIGAVARPEQAEWKTQADNLTREEADQKVARMRTMIGWRGYEIRTTSSGPRLAIEVKPIPEPEVKASDKRALPGAPDIEGATGPDPALVAVAEQYARDNGITLRRQASYAHVDVFRAQRIADEWENVKDDPNNPRVKRAYEALAQQTLAQYKVLEDAGYKFYFYDETNDPYKENPWNAMRDLRSTKSMAVFSTKAGYGNEFKDSLANGGPMLVDTGLRWANSKDGEATEPVLFNDLFRAVHDAFGHGLEGAGFRGRGEENAWQAHRRLYTGDAIGALTSETRGQNSWLNYGPYGLQNRNAKVNKVIFADQKTGLMPSWTWTEGVVGDMPEGGIQASEKRILLNIGLSTKEVKGEGMLTEDVVRSALAKLGLKVDSIPVHPSDTELTAVPAIDRPLTQAEGDDLSVRLNQQSIVQRMPDGSGMLFGPKADEWGPYNPAYFVMRDGRFAVEHEIQASTKRRKVQVEGEEVPTSVDRVADSAAAFRRARGKVFETNRELKTEIQDAVRAAAEDAGVDLSTFSKETEKYLVRIATAEAVKALRENANAIGWYREKVTKALRIAALKHPELNTDPQSRMVFIWALAVTSNGMRVKKNFELADKAYSSWKRYGKFPVNIGQGTAKKAINNGLRAYNVLSKKMTFEQLHDAMLTKSPVAQIGKLLGIKPSGEYADTIVYGSAILGPKVGNGFFANLYGHYEQLTIDRWLMRTWGRWTGTLIEVDPKEVAAKTDKLSALLDMLSTEQRTQLEQAIGRTVYDDDLEPTAAAISAATIKESVRDALDEIGPLDKTMRARLVEILGKEKANSKRVSLGDEIRKAGIGLHGAIDGQVEAPRDPQQRNDMRKVFDQVLAELQKTNPGLTMSDLQAVLWYPEKRIYDAAKTDKETDDGYEDGAAPDYANAAAEHYRGRGVAKSAIDRVIAQVDSELQTADGSRPGGRGPGGVAQQPRSAGVVASEKRTPLGFYSALADGVDKIKTNAAPAQGWKDAIKGLVNKGAVKADEVEWSGINDWLDLQQGKVTKEQVAEYLEQGGVQVEETVLGGADYVGGLHVDQSDSGNWHVVDDEARVIDGPFDSEEEADSAMANLAQGQAPTKYSQYTLPGGENYREVLLTLPERVAAKVDTAGWTAEKVNDKSPVTGLPEYRVYDATGQSRGKTYRSASPEEAIRYIADATDRLTADQQRYRSTHWDQPNVLAHIRLNDRTDADGKRVLFVEELQSDWGQEGKKKGFVQPMTPAKEARIKELEAEVKAISDSWGGLPALLRASKDDPDAQAARAKQAELRAEVARIQEASGVVPSGGVKSGLALPTAPFVTKTEGWLNLALKRVMIMAAEGGYDKVAFTDAEPHFKRWGTERIDWAKQPDGSFLVRAKSQEGGDAAGMNLEAEAVARGLSKTNSNTVRSVKELEDTIRPALTEGQNAADLAPKIWERMQAEGAGTAMPRREGFEAFYGDKSGMNPKTGAPSFLAGSLRKLLPKVGGGQMSEVPIILKKSRLDEMSPEDRYEAAQEFAFDPDAMAELNKLKQEMTRQSGFDVTDAMRAKVAEGLPLFSRQRVFHGTPHRGIDKFSTDHIGTGEGVQAYGWGLYFASRREIAEHYRKTLAPPTEINNWRVGSVDIIRNGEFRDYSPKDSSKMSEARANIAEYMLIREPEIKNAYEEGGVDAAKKVMREVLDQVIDTHDYLEKELKILGSAFDRKGGVVFDATQHLGQLYEVEIPQNSEMLDWDKPLSEQEQAGLLREIANEEDMQMEYRKKALHGSRTGEDFYKAMSQMLGGDEAASRVLNSYGIKGIKYLDGTSRSAGDGSYNYVVFGGDDVAIQQTYYSRQRQTETPEFKRWFGDSKVVDGRGRPLVVYHGTTKDFVFFNRGYDGIFFTDSAKMASRYADTDGGSVMPVYLSIKNAAPLSVQKQYGYNSKKLAEAGYDGIIETINKGEPDERKIYIAFEPTQIKSAIGNNGDFDPNNPDIRKSEKRIFDPSGRTYTPEQIKAMDNVGFITEKLTLKERFDLLKKDIGKKMAQGLADQFRPIKDLDKHAYALARLSKGAAGAVEAVLKHGKLSLTKDGAYDADTTGGALERVFMPLRNEVTDFLRWVSAYRAADLTQQDRENLFTAEDIAALKTLDQGTTDFDYVLRNGKTTRDRTLIFKDALVNYDEFNQNVLDMAEQSGLISPDVRKTLGASMYVPFYREGEDGLVYGTGPAAALVRQEAFKKLKGGQQKLKSDLLQSVLMNWGNIIEASARNRAGLATLNAASQMGVAVEAPEAVVRQMGASINNRKGVVWVQDQGVRRHFLVEDPYLLTAISSLQYSGMKGPIMDAMSAFKHWMTIGVTSSPAFKIRNLVRDSMTAVATAPLSANLLENVRAGAASASAKDQSYVSALAGGGLIRFNDMVEGNQSARVRQLIRMGTDDSTILNSPDKVQAVRNRFEKAFMAYNELGNISEEVNRLALYKKLKSEGMSDAEANLAARDLMDFSMQGTWSTVRFLTQVVPFLNARIQGLYKLGRATKEDPARVAAVLGSVAVASLALAAAYSDDDDWKKREDWDRNNFWWFKLGGVAYRVPKPFELGAVATLAERGADFMWDKNMTGARYGKIVKDLLMDNLSMNPVPQAFKPVLDIYSNKDSFTGRPIETMGMDRLNPDYRFTQNTSMLSRGLSTAGQSVVEATGLDRTGVRFLSPVQVDALVHGYFSWLGSLVTGTSDIVLRQATGQPTRPTMDYYKFATQGIAQEVSSGSSYFVSSLYDQAKVIEQAYGTWRQLLKEGRTKEAAEFFADNKSDITRYQAFERVKAGESKFNEMIRMIERSAKDPDQKKAEIQRIRERQDKLARVVTEIR